MNLHYFGTKGVHISQIPSFDNVTFDHQRDSAASMVDEPLHCHWLLSFVGRVEPIEHFGNVKIKTI